MIDYEALDAEYEDTPKTEKISPSQKPVNGHSDMLKRVENTRNRLRKEGYDVSSR